MRVACGGVSMKKGAHASKPRARDDDAAERAPESTRRVRGNVPLHKLSPFELKDVLIEIADEATKTRAATMLNAGRGNPNWIATAPREAFFLIGSFAIAEARRTWDEPDVGLAGMPSSPEIADRFARFLESSPKGPGNALLRKALDYAVKELGFDADAFVWELADSAIGDNYPVPDRMLVHSEKVAHAFLAREMCDGRPPPGKFDLFAVEGGTAAMTYIFHSLMANRVLSKGDTIALGTPIFTPYLEIPPLDEYQLKVVQVRQTEMSPDGRHAWQYSESELAKLEDPRIKAFFLVNPANPGAVAVAPKGLAQIAHIVKTKRPDLIILTDDVYGTFVEGFRSLAAELPRNTLLVYSYSKHFGCTGWRLGVIALHEDNVIDEMIARLPEKDRDALHRRYQTLTLEPDKLKFIDRIVADSRSVALNHTAGLSLPQQLQMMLFSLFALVDDEDRYKKRCRAIVRNRLAGLARGLEIPLSDDPNRTAYYQTLDLENWCRQHVGEEFMEYVKEHADPLDIVLGMARRGSVLLNGNGFDAPPWSARVSLANLDDDAYPKIGQELRSMVNEAIDRWKKSRSGG
jgi:aspartate 4-decarboxylase